MPEPEAVETQTTKQGGLVGRLMKPLLMLMAAFLAATGLMYGLTLQFQNGVPPVLAGAPVVGGMLRRAFPHVVSIEPRIWQRDDTESFLKAAAKVEIEQLRTSMQAMGELRSSIAAEGDRLQAARDAFAAVRQNVENLLAVPGSEREANVKRLATLYGSMRSEEAAKIVSSMDKGMVIEIIKRMDERAAGKLLAAMDPADAADLSAEIGGTQVREIGGE